MNTNSIIKIAAGVILLSLFLPTHYFELNETIRMVIILFGIVLGIKLIFDGTRQL